MNLTTTEQEQVNQAAKDYCNAMYFQGEDLRISDAKIAFGYGVTYAISTILPGRMEKFSEWLRTFEALERQNGQWVIESQISDKQIVKAFIEDIKQKQDAH